MAVLKDLIVHGRSRFLNGAQFNTINAESIGANEGIFNKLIATTLDAKEATIDDLRADNAVITGLLDVQGQMQTNSWTNSNIATIDGSFYICPTISSEAQLEGLGPQTDNKFFYNGSTVILTGSWATTGSLYLNDTAANWTLFSKVMLTGEVLIGNEWTPIGTIRGELQGINPPTGSNTKGTITIGSLSTNITPGHDGTISSAPMILSLVTANTTYSARKLKVSLYEYNTEGTSSSATNLIGIMMTTSGTHGFTYLDIYNGLNSKTSYTSTVDNTTEATEPMVRIGNLNGLPNIVTNGTADTQPTGWGIYTTNGFFKGTIVSNAGKIGGWTISDLKLYTGSHDTYNSTYDGIYLGQVSNDYFISGGPEAQWYLKSDGTGRIGELTITKEVVGGDTIFTATIPAMNITGKLKANQIETDFITLGLDEAIEGTITYVYEHYVLTTDTTVQQDKTYYNRTGSGEPYTYVAVDDPSGNPQTNGWYEVISETVFKNNIEDTYYYLTISSTYVLTTDTEVQQDKIYYSRTGSAEPYTYVAVDDPSDNPQASNYYERIDEEIETDVEIDKLKRDTTDKLITNRMEDGINTSINSLSTQTNFLQGRVQEINNITIPLNDKVNTHLIEENEGNALSLKVNESIDTFLKLDSDGIYLYSNTDSVYPVAKYGTDVTLGKTSENHIKLSSNNGLQFISFHNEEVASFNSDVLIINQAEIKNMLQISDFRWSTSNKTISGTSYKRVSFVYSPQLTEE